MTADRRHLVRSPLAMRLIGGFVAVAVVAVFVLAGLTLWRTKHSVGQLARERQQATADAIADTLGFAYQRSGGWDTVDPHPAMMLAVQAGASLTVVDNSGNALVLRNTMGNMPQMATNAHGPTRTASVIVNGEQVGTAQVTFVSFELAQAEMHVRDALSGTVAIGALIAGLVAALMAAPIAVRIVRPLRRVTDAAQRLGDGDATARAGEHRAPGEIGTLNRTFDAMADRLQANDVARRNLAADVAHELRTPLATIDAYLEGLADGVVEPSAETWQLLRSESRRLGRITEDLTKVSQAEERQLELRLEPVDALSLLEAAAGAATPAFAAKGVELQISPGGDGLRVGVDPDRLGEVLANLLANALRHTPAGGTVTLAAERADDDVILTVTDTGDGLVPDDLERVFERFYRADRSRSRDQGGSGIGLAIARALVEAHGGRLSVESPGKGQGARFICSLPAG